MYELNKMIIKLHFVTFDMKVLHLTCVLLLLYYQFKCTIQIGLIKWKLKLKLLVW